MFPMLIGRNYKEKTEVKSIKTQILKGETIFKVPPLVWNKKESYKKRQRQREVCWPIY